MIQAVMDEKTPWGPRSEEEKNQVRQQMQRLLETAHFKNSRRYPALLRFIVEETLEGRGDLLKERLLGVRVFNRPPDYDTANDPIVRVTIAEVRKRIAQYYHDPGHETEMRIELMPGHYAPEFHSARVLVAGFEEGPTASKVPGSLTNLTETSAPVALQAAAAETTLLAAGGRRNFSVLTRWVAIAGTMALLAMVSTGLWQWAHPSAIDELWGPVLAARRPVTFCIPTGQRRGSQIAAAAGILAPQPATPLQHGTYGIGMEGAPAPSFLQHENDGENVTFSDVLATLKMSDWVAAHGRESRLRSDNGTTLYDLQQGPTILIGGLDNEWTLRALNRMRYRFSGTEHEEYWITDSKNPARRDWVLDLKSRYSAVTYDFALIARLHDESTGQVQLIAAGIGMSATAAAGRFLVDPAQLEELRRRIGPGFRNHDFEAVLGTDVVNGIPGSAKILAVAVW
jgi:hypothetical protein